MGVYEISVVVEGGSAPATRATVNTATSVSLQSQHPRGSQRSGPSLPVGRKVQLKLGVSRATIQPRRQEFI